MDLNTSLLKVVGSTSVLAVGFEYSVIGNLTKLIEESNEVTTNFALLQSFI